MLSKPSFPHARSLGGPLGLRERQDALEMHAWPLENAPCLGSCRISRTGCEFRDGSSLRLSLRQLELDGWHRSRRSCPGYRGGHSHGAGEPNGQLLKPPSALGPRAWARNHFPRIDPARGCHMRSQAQAEATSQTLTPISQVCGETARRPSSSLDFSSVEIGFPSVIWLSIFPDRQWPPRRTPPRRERSKPTKGERGS